jgi:hypothetical protein
LGLQLRLNLRRSLRLCLRRIRGLRLGRLLGRQFPGSCQQQKNARDADALFHAYALPSRKIEYRRRIIPRPFSLRRINSPASDMLPIKLSRQPRLHPARTLNFRSSMRRRRRTHDPRT